MFNSYIKLKVSISFTYDSVSEVHRKPLGREAVTNLDGVLKSRDIALSTKFHIKAMVFPIVMHGCMESHMEEEMATHFSILTWRIPWTEKPG